MALHFVTKIATVSFVAQVEVAQALHFTGPVKVEDTGDRMEHDGT